MIDIGQTTYYTEGTRWSSMQSDDLWPRFFVWICKEILMEDLDKTRKNGIIALVNSLPCAASDDKSLVEPVKRIRGRPRKGTGGRI
jgi:hypothetical protein